MLKKALHTALPCALLLYTSILIATPPDEFYLVRLRAGVEAYRRGNPVVAADEFRIACFGFLEQPVLLVEGLARLSLAQAKTGRSADADGALSRFAEVEQRFGTFREATLEPEVRAEFVELARRRMPSETFRSLPSISGPPSRKEEKPGTPESAPQPVRSVTEIEGGAPPVAKEGKRGVVEDIRRLIDEGKAVEAWTKAQEALRKGAPSRELGKAALAAAVLSSDFGPGVAVAVSLDPFKTGEETEVFYAGVAFWETGNREKATALFRIAAPRIAKSPWVKHYLSQALGN